MTTAQRLQNEYLRERREHKRTQNLRVLLTTALPTPAVLTAGLPAHVLLLCAVSCDSVIL
jgi:hypothetical protein